MSAISDRILIVGAGHAGVALAVALTKLDDPREIVLVGDEPSLPYERPPLTKRLLYDDGDPGVVPLRSADYWDRSPVVLRLPERVVRIDPRRRTVCTAAGAEMSYGTLVWAAGGRAAPCGIPGEDSAGVHSIRDFADLSALRADLDTARAVVVVGGGYVGLEAAAALRARRLAVTVVEVGDRLLGRVAGRRTSAFLEALHRREGTDIRTGTTVERIRQDGTHATAVALADGSEIPTDVVVVGVGMRPAVGILLAAGARGSLAGVTVDATCRTSLPDVYAIGDCAEQCSAWSPHETPVRIESVHNAGQQAATVARALTGRAVVDPEPPRFWSTQYGQEFKMVGLVSPLDDEVLRGDPDSSNFSVLYLRNGRLAAIDTVNRQRDFARAQALIAARWSPQELGPLTDPDADLPRLVSQSAR